MPAVKSTCLSRADYDADAATLTLTFKDGTTYDYFGVAQQDYSELLRATSKGGEFNAEIRNAGFPYQRR